MIVHIQIPVNIIRTSPILDFHYLLQGGLIPAFLFPFDLLSPYLSNTVNLSTPLAQRNVVLKRNKKKEGDRTKYRVLYQAGKAHHVPRFACKSHLPLDLAPCSHLPAALITVYQCHHHQLKRSGCQRDQRDDYLPSAAAKMGQMVR